MSQGVYDGSEIDEDLEILGRVFMPHCQSSEIEPPWLCCIICHTMAQWNQPVTQGKRGRLMCCNGTGWRLIPTRILPALTTPGCPHTTKFSCDCSTAASFYIFTEIFDRPIEIIDPAQKGSLGNPVAWSFPIRGSRTQLGGRFPVFSDTKNLLLQNLAQTCGQWIFASSVPMLRVFMNVIWQTPTV